MEIRERAPAAVVREDLGAGPALTLTCEVRGHSTVLRVRGTVDAARTEQLAEGLEMARAIRGRGPILVDLSGVDRLGWAAMQCLVRAVRDAERSGRTLTLQI
jgi:anti-anti-sigma factor